MKKYLILSLLVGLMANTSQAEIKEISSLHELDSYLHTKGTSLVVLDFYITNCGPCNATAPHYLQVSNDSAYAAWKFLKTKAARNNDIADKYGVTSAPTFIIFKNGKQVEVVKGKQNLAQLKALLNKYTA